MSVLVTGANGFVGAALCERFCRDGIVIRGAVRSLSPLRGDYETTGVGSISPETDWFGALRYVHQVVHLAARVHIMNDRSSDPLAEFRRINVEGTANLARQAAAAGVRRFVYLSSIKVNGKSTELGRAFTSVDMPDPEDPYGVSKHEAEQLLRQIAVETGMEVVIIRPPLVYGPGVKANFESMMHLLARGVPLPLAAITDNRRSLVAIDNLVDLVVTCLGHQAAANQTFLVSDGEDISTVDLLRRMGEAQGTPARLFYVPVAVLRFGAAILGKRSICNRLCDSLQVDIGKTRELLGWKPPVSVDEGLCRTAKGLRA